MYTLVTSLDFQKKRIPSVRQLKILLDKQLLDPISCCLAHVLIKEIEAKNYPTSSKRLLRSLEDFHDEDQRVISPIEAYRTLTKSQAVCLYLSYFLENYPVRQIQNLLVGSTVILAETHIVCLPHTLNDLSTEEYEKLTGDWLKTSRVKLLREIPSIRYGDLFVYCYIQNIDQFVSVEDDVLEYIWGPAADKQGTHPSLQKDAKIIVQAPIYSEYKELSPEDKRFCMIQTVDEFIDIVSSRNRLESHGIIAIPNLHFEVAGRLVKFLRGWTFMASHPASYCDYREIKALAHGQYAARITNYVPATLRNSISISSLEATEMNYLFDFLSREFPNVIPLLRATEDNLDSDTEYRVLDLDHGSVRLVGPKMRKAEILPPAEHENLWIQTIQTVQTPVAGDVFVVIMVVATWDVMFYDNLIHLDTDKESEIPMTIRPLLNMIARFYRGIPIANSVNVYGYLTYMIDFIETPSGVLNLSRVAAGEPLLPDSLVYYNYYKWITETCILPVCAAQDCRLVEMEYVSNSKTLEQFKELVSDPEKMRYIGKGTVWSAATIKDYFKQQYEDSSQSETEKKYFDWLLVDADDNLLAYVSIRPYKKMDKQIRVVAREQGKGYGKRAVFLAHNQYYLRTDRRELYAIVDAANQASLRLFDSLFPGWTRKESGASSGSNGTRIVFVADDRLDNVLSALGL